MDGSPYILFRIDGNFSFQIPPVEKEFLFAEIPQTSSKQLNGFPLKIAVLSFPMIDPSVNISSGSNTDRGFPGI
jgi:hypothetical protein